MDRQKRNKIVEITDNAIRALAYSCIEVEWESAERILRIYIDGPNGINMDDCILATRVLNELAELDEMIRGSYRLEVSSPGVERPLRTLDHFREVIGETVAVSLLEQVAGRKKGKGTLKEVADSGGFTLTIDSIDWSCPIELLIVPT